MRRPPDAAALADQLILPVTDPRGHDLAAALARIGGNGAEVDALLSIPTETLRAAAARQPEPRLTGSGMNNVVVSP